MTTFIQIHEGELPDRVRPDDWKPWINCSDRDEAINLAINQRVRFRGGLSHGEKITLHVLDFKEGDPVRADGNPWMLTNTTFSLSKP